MSHKIENQQKLIAKINKAAGQLNSAKNAIEDGENCYTALHRLAAVKGAINAIMNDVLNAHVEHHLFETENKKEEIEHLQSIIKSYFKA